MITSRRYDLDWLRVIAFTFLIYFHAAIFFIPGGLPLIQNAKTSPGLEIFVDLSHQFRLALLFFISGVGVAFARRRRNSRAFITERSQRLLIPLVMGIVFIVPPMVYTEKLFTGAIDTGFLAFYPRFFTEGIYPQGYLSWHHLWFVAYLYLFCLLGSAIFECLDGKRLAWFARQYDGIALYRYILPLFVVEILLRAFFPGFRDLIHDWASFFHWFLIFLAGFVFANQESLLNSAVCTRYISLTAACAATALLYSYFGGPSFAPTEVNPRVLVDYLIFCALRMTMAWCWILVCIGFAGRYLRFSNGLLVYLNEAVYPLFILHLPVLTVIGYAIIDLDWHLWTKYWFVTSASIIVILAAYHWLIRRLVRCGMCLG